MVGFFYALASFYIRFWDTFPLPPPGTSYPGLERWILLQNITPFVALNLLILGVYYAQSRSLSTHKPIRLAVLGLVFNLLTIGVLWLAFRPWILIGHQWLFQWGCFLSGIMWLTLGFQRSEKSHFKANPLKFSALIGLSVIGIGLTLLVIHQLLQHAPQRSRNRIG